MVKKLNIIRNFYLCQRVKTIWFVDNAITAIEEEK